MIDEHTMPTLFIGHGNPMNAIEETPFVAAWREQAASLPRPKAILCVSAHWETYGTRERQHRT
jgi:4,5-DOPA dioxygenase extradiol